MIEAAGGKVLIPTEQGEISLFGLYWLSTDQLLDLAKEADVFISPGPLSDDIRDELRNTTILAELPIYDNQGPLGSNDWFERRIAEPDGLLLDFGAILWPAAFPEIDDNFQFLRNVDTTAPGFKVPVDQLEAECPDPDEPYVFLGEDCPDPSTAPTAIPSPYPSPLPTTLPTALST